MAELNTHFAALEHALSAVAPATGSVLDPDAYPGLKIARAPAAATDLDPLVTAAFEAATWPEYGAPIPLVAELTEAQRALADLVANAPGVPLYKWAVPQTSRSRRQWLGIEAAGALGRDISYTVHGEQRAAPLWRALWELDDAGEQDQAVALFTALPIADRVDAYGELAFEGFRVEPPTQIDDPGDACGEWAAAYADRLVEMFAPEAPHIERGGNHEVPAALRSLVFAALRGSCLDLEERWDDLVPFDLDVIGSLPSSRRAAVLVRCLRDEFPSWACRKGIPAIQRFGSAPVVEHLLERADQCTGSLGCPPRRAFVAQIREAVAAQDELVAMVDAYVAQLPALPELSCTRKLYPKSVDELTAGQRAQLAVLGQGWETDDGAVAWEQDGEVVFGPLEFISAFEIADSDGNPAFEALLYMDEDGAVCRAGTTNSVAYVCQERLEWNIDVETVEALHAILRERPAER